MVTTTEYLFGGPNFDPANAFDQTVLFGTQTGASATQIFFEASPGFRVVFGGTFVVDGGGVVQSGTVTGFQVFIGTTNVANGQDFAIATADLYTAIAGPTDFFYQLFYTGKQVGSSQTDYLWGQSGILLGRAGNDVIYGGDDAITMRGGKGDDVLYDANSFTNMFGGKGDDYFMIGGGVAADSIGDFRPAHDTIGLAAFAFDAIGLGFLTDAEFIKGPAAITPEQHIIYTRSTGQLFYDNDGSGPEAQVLIATLDPRLNLHAYDFVGILGAL